MCYLKELTSCYRLAGVPMVGPQSIPVPPHGGATDAILRDSGVDRPKSS